MNTDNIILNGIHIGEHEFVPEKIIDEIKTRCIDAGFNYAVLRPHVANISGEDFCKWAKYLADNEIYFMFLYTVVTDSTNEKRSLLTRDTVKIWVKRRETTRNMFRNSARQIKNSELTT